MTNAELIEIMKNDDPDAQVDFSIFYGNGELKPVVHGKWIKDKGDHMYHCTRCYTRWVHVDDMNYCPRCGADMRDSKVSENPTGSD